jgi:hypothetical protein
MELDSDLRPVGVHASDELREPRHAAVVVDAELMRAAAPARVDERRLDVDPADASPRARLVVGEGPLGDGAVAVCEVALHRRHEDAVADLHRAHRERAKEVL